MPRIYPHATPQAADIAKEFKSSRFSIDDFGTVADLMRELVYLDGLVFPAKSWSLRICTHLESLTAPATYAFRQNFEPLGYIISIQDIFRKFSRWNRDLSATRDGRPISSDLIGTHRATTYACIVAFAAKMVRARLQMEMFNFSLFDPNKILRHSGRNSIRKILKNVSPSAKTQLTMIENDFNEWNYRPMLHRQRCMLYDADLIQLLFLHRYHSEISETELRDMLLVQPW